mmetsp:Transcript_13545/g.22330  ORF Transcript_13545/g.22330 Transcript_13545/m.22330 type:complete len:241 (-) Transcript_13545:780-1502(-)
MQAKIPQALLQLAGKVRHQCPGRASVYGGSRNALFDKRLADDAQTSANRTQRLAERLGRMQSDSHTVLVEVVSRSLLASGQRACHGHRRCSQAKSLEHARGGTHLVCAHWNAVVLSRIPRDFVKPRSLGSAAASEATYSQTICPCVQAELRLLHRRNTTNEYLNIARVLCLQSPDEVHRGVCHALIDIYIQDIGACIYHRLTSLPIILRVGCYRCSNHQLPCVVTGCFHMRTDSIDIATT